MMTETIAAVVVTYNRLTLLKECIEAIRKQSRKLDAIIVVNNGSTDDTKNWLDAQTDLAVIHQENIGGAGGFKRGIAEAYGLNYNWVWIMDDDGLPDQDCLKNLLTAATEYNALYAAPNLIDFDGISHFKDKFENCPLPYIYDIGGPFNAILLKRELITEIGYPNELFFIWGDEYEYTDRIIEKGLVVITVKNALHTHKRTHFEVQKCPRPYFFIRNRFWRYRAVNGVFTKRRRLKYEAYDYTARLFFKGLLYFNFKQAKEVIKGVYDGLYKDYQ